MSEKFRLDCKNDFPNTSMQNLKCINIIFKYTSPSIILRSIICMYRGATHKLKIYKK